MNIGYYNLVSSTRTSISEGICLDFMRVQIYEWGVLGPGQEG